VKRCYFSLPKTLLFLSSYSIDFRLACGALHGMKRLLLLHFGFENRDSDTYPQSSCPERLVASFYWTPQGLCLTLSAFLKAGSSLEHSGHFVSGLHRSAGAYRLEPTGIGWSLSNGIAWHRLRLLQHTICLCRIATYDQSSSYEVH
jgi:hypothetical protein